MSLACFLSIPPNLFCKSRAYDLVMFLSEVRSCVFYVKKTADMVGSGFDGNDIAFQSISISVIARMGAW